MANISADEFSSAIKCVLERFNIDKFRETQQEAILNLLKGKDVSVLQPTALGKSVIFQSFPLIVDAASIMSCAQLPYAGPSQVPYFNRCKSS